MSCEWRQRLGTTAIPPMFSPLPVFLLFFAALLQSATFEEGRKKQTHPVPLWDSSVEKWELSPALEATQTAKSKTLKCVLIPRLTGSGLKTMGIGSFQIGRDHLPSWR